MDKKTINLRDDIAETIGITASNIIPHIEYGLLESTKEDGYIRQLIEYDSYGDKVTAFLLLPEILDKNPAILINHQHNREHHLGKSEVCGLAGNPLQAFGPVLAKKGFVVLAPDSICFEERRRDAHGIESVSEDADFWQHYNEMCYRIIKGESLMKKVLVDAMNGITLLSNLTYVDNRRIGTLGHSMGGNTVLFLSALDERITFSCASGSACTYENRIKNNVGIEMASIIPDFHSKYDIYDLVSCIAPRRLLIVSAEDDKYSKDASYIVDKAGSAYLELDAIQNLSHKRYPGGHGLTKERFDFIIEWLNSNTSII
ncbi:MAG: prolyl oligopeptidase family serine peptidase [Lachnospiraceae bacterium]|nr:prolyl oligopeptidase family serine peptidase [Lachnospiraceae bacterium]